ncbi:MAG: purine-nucleoside phosphorylase [Halanaerobiales bacterium]|nr:purine-nucleoside phosphorylase [Halanaerobiales bacterium]
MFVEIKEAAEYIKQKIDLEPEVGLILGSGLGILAEEIEDSIVIPYQEIPNFPVSTVEGHAGRLVIGRLEGKPVVAMQGRFHYYEGYSMQKLTLPVRVMKMLGVEKLLVTNAAGGVNRNFNPGDFMIITDHVNLMGDNPLRGQNLEEFGPRFPDMTEAYNHELIKLAERVGAEKGIMTRKGVYAALSGPSYETPAEIRFLASNGFDAVGMSTVPEVIVANHMGLDVLGISCITNMAAGILARPLNHEEVMETAERVKPKFITLVRGILKKI